MLKNCYSTYSDGVFHPFQYGLIFRKSEDFVVVAANSGALIISEVLDESGANMRPIVKVGDRFITPRKCLDEAMQYRAYYSSSGLIDE